MTQAATTQTYHLFIHGPAERIWATAGLVAWALPARGRRLTRPEAVLLLGVYASTLPLLR
jgi:hypothetical protein